MPVEIQPPTSPLKGGKTVCLLVTGVAGPPLTATIRDQDGHPIEVSSVTPVSGSEMTYRVCFVYPFSGDPVTVNVAAGRDGDVTIL